MQNRKIRAALVAYGMKHWELADLMEIHPATLSAKLRHELPEEEQEEIVEKIKASGREKIIDA